MCLVDWLDHLNELEFIHRILSGVQLEEILQIKFVQQKYIFTSIF